MSDTNKRSVASAGSVVACFALFAAGLCVPPAIQLLQSEPASDVASIVRERNDARREVAKLAFEVGVLREFIHNSAMAQGRLRNER